MTKKTKQSKAQRIREVLKKNPEASNQAIAYAVGCNVSYVYMVRGEMQAAKAEVDSAPKAPVAYWENEEPEAPVHDEVNHPAHYTDGGIETIDFIEAKLSPEEFRGYCLGNALKYLSRTGKKGDPIIDLQKAQWYLARIAKEG